MHHEYHLLTAGIVFTLMFFTASLLKAFKFPYIVSFMLTGLVFKFLLPAEELELLALFEHSAVAILFFFIGLEYSFERLLGMVRVIKPGIIDLLINFLPAFFISYVISKDLPLSLILASALYPSSTAITAKLFMDYKRVINPEFDLLIGILIFEDLVSVILLSFLSGLSTGFDITHLIKSLLLLVVSFLLFYLLIEPAKRLFEFLDKKVDEILLVFLVVGFLLLLSGLAVKVGISEALIAFLLGVLVPENSNIYKRIETTLFSLKELSLGVFFFFFTYKAQFGDTSSLLLALVLVVVITLSKFVSTYLASRTYGLSPRVSLRASLSFIQRGEFSLIIASLYFPAQGIVFFAVLITSLLGSFSFAFGPRLVDKVFPKKRYAKAPPPAP